MALNKEECHRSVYIRLIDITQIVALPDMGLVNHSHNKRVNSLSYADATVLLPPIAQVLINRCSSYAIHLGIVTQYKNCMIVPPKDSCE